MKRYLSPTSSIACIKVFLILILFASCARSLHPLTEKEEEMVFKKELLGNWRVQKDNGYPHNDVSYIVDTIEKTQGKQYKIKVISQDPDTGETDTSHMVAFLVKINQNHFIDCSVDTSRESFRRLDETEQGFLINTHVISKIKIIDNNTISNSYIDIDKLDDMIFEKKININLTYLNNDEDDVLLLEPGKELQKKLNEQSKLISVFTNEEKLKRF